MVAYHPRRGPHSIAYPVKPVEVDAWLAAGSEWVQDVTLRHFSLIVLIYNLGVVSCQLHTLVGLSQSGPSCTPIRKLCSSPISSQQETSGSG